MAVFACHCEYNCVSHSVCLYHTNCVVLLFLMCLLLKWSKQWAVGDMYPGTS